MHASFLKIEWSEGWVCAKNRIGLAWEKAAHNITVRTGVVGVSWRHRSEDGAVWYVFSLLHRFICADLAVTPEK